MRQAIMLAAICAVVSLFGESAQAQTNYVKPYVKSDGTYVQPHFKTNPNSTKLDNWSTKGNVNPYTGKKGTKSPW